MRKKCVLSPLQGSYGLCNIPGARKLRCPRLHSDRPFGAKTRLRDISKLIKTHFCKKYAALGDPPARLS